MNVAKIDRAARKMCRHTIVFNDAVDALVVARSMQGRSTRAIADEFGLSESQVQYRVMKAQNSLKTKFRADYRTGKSKVAQQMLHATERLALGVIRKQIAPKFIPLARAGVSRM